MKKLLSLVCFLFLGFVAHAQTLEGIYRSFGDAYGGSDRINSIKTITEEVQIESRGRTMTITHYISYPDKHRIEVLAEGKKEIYILNGNHGQSLVNDWLVDVPAEQIADFKESMKKYALIFDREQFNPKRDDRKTTFEGLDTIKGTQAYKIKMADNSKSDRFLYIDTKTNRAIKTVSRQFVKFNVYKEVEIFQDSITKYGTVYAPSLIIAKTPMGQTLLTQRLRRLEIDVAIPDSMFIIEEKKK